MTINMNALLDALAARILGSMELPDTVKAERPSVKVADVVAERDGNDTSAPAQRARRKRTARGITTTYAVQWKGKGEPAIQRTPLEVWRAALKLQRAKQPITEASLMKATGRTENSIQSGIWWLRNHDAKGERVDASSKRSLMVNSK